MINVLRQIQYKTKCFYFLARIKKHYRAFDLETRLYQANCNHGLIRELILRLNLLKLTQFYRDRLLTQEL